MKYLVVVNGEPPSTELLNSLIQSHDGVVAVDGGLYACLECGLDTKLLMGDFDSITEQIRQKCCHINQIEASDQNKSDLDKTLSYLFEQGATEITVCGATGKRLDHTLTNVLLLTRYPEKVRIVTDNEICFALKPSTTLQCQAGQTLSLIPFSTSVKQVFTKGLKWELEGRDLSKDFIGISNICLQSTVTISFAEGDLIVCLNRLASA